MLDIFLLPTKTKVFLVEGKKGEWTLCRCLTLSAAALEIILCDFSLFPLHLSPSYIETVRTGAVGITQPVHGKARTNLTSATLTGVRFLPCAAILSPQNVLKFIQIYWYCLVFQLPQLCRPTYGPESVLGIHFVSFNIKKKSNSAWLHLEDD